jgi:hypothetical protein
MHKVSAYSLEPKYECEYTILTKKVLGRIRNKHITPRWTFVSAPKWL